MKLALSRLSFSIIGVGRMGEAILQGLVAAVPVRNVSVVTRTARRLHQLKKIYRVKGSIHAKSGVMGRDVVLFCVKPQVLPQVLRALKPIIAPNQLLISIAAGVRLSTLQACFPKNPIARVMPNQPCQIRQGISGLAFGRLVNPQHKAWIRAIFSAIGNICEVKESRLDAVTAVGGSGPGFLYYLAEHFIQGGVAAGLSRREAELFVREVFWGVGHVLKMSSLAPLALCQAVTSPQGTTAAGLTELEKRRWGTVLQQAIRQATSRAKALSQLGSQTK